MMSCSAIILFVCLAIANTNGFDCPKVSCTRDVEAKSSKNEIPCSKLKSEIAGFNLTVNTPNHVTIHCDNSSNWVYFSLDSVMIDMKNVDCLEYVECQMPSVHHGGKFLQQFRGIDRVKYLKVIDLKNGLKKRHFNAHTHLETLVLANNHLGQVYAKLLYGLKNLIKLNLHNTQIQLSTGFFKRSKFLTHLDLSNNNLTDLEPGIFDGLGNLIVLNLRQNHFDFIQPKIFHGLESLKFLDMSDCHLLALPNGIFFDTFNLTSLNLSANNFISIPANWFSKNPKLKFVQLTYNEYEKMKLFPRMFSHLDYLKVVKMDGNNLTDLPENIFWDSTGLIELSLNDNQLDRLPAKLLRDAKELRRLSISSNYITSLPDRFFDSTVKLMRLDISNNRLSTLDKYFADGLKALLEINLEGNNLHSIHAGAFLSLVHLKIVKLAHNQLDFQNYLKSNKSPFEHCGKLEVLDLSYNKVNEMYKDWISNLTRLCKLDLSHNEFQYIQSEDILFTSKQITVDLSSNHITVVNLTLLENLVLHANITRNITIDINGNPIECYCHVYSLQYFIDGRMKPEVYQSITLKTDEITCKNPEILQNTTLSGLNGRKLECTVDNGHSELCAANGICDCWFLPNDQIFTIDCSDRNLTVIPEWINSWQVFEYRLAFNFTANNLSNVPNMSDNSYERIEFLSLAKNQITELDENLILPMLKEVNLEQNNLSRINLHLIKALTENITSLWLGNNPWICDNSTLDFRNYVMEHKFSTIKDYENVICADTGRYVWEKPITLWDIPKIIFSIILGLIIMLVSLLVVVLLTAGFVVLIVCYKRN